MVLSVAASNPSVGKAALFWERPEVFTVASYAAVRHFVFVDGHSRREAARMFGLYWETVARNSRFSLPPGYTRTEPVAQPKLGPLLPVIDAILEADRTAPVNQRHTPMRIFAGRPANTSSNLRSCGTDRTRRRDLASLSEGAFESPQSEIGPKGDKSDPNESGCRGFAPARRRPCFLRRPAARWGLAPFLPPVIRDA